MNIIDSKTLVSIIIRKKPYAKKITATIEKNGAIRFRFGSLNSFTYHTL